MLKKLTTNLLHTHQMNTHINIRKAAPQDLPHAHQLIQELADYENAPEEVILTLEQFIADGTSTPPSYYLQVAEITHEDGRTQIIGMALFYLIYSTWKGKVIYLEDLVVTEQYRRHGVGQQLIEAVLDIARSMQVNQVRWHVLDWNEPAINFYKKMGVKMEEDWTTCKVEQALLYKGVHPKLS